MILVLSNDGTQLQVSARGIAYGYDLHQLVRILPVSLSEPSYTVIIMEQYIFRDRLE